MGNQGFRLHTSPRSLRARILVGRVCKGNSVSTQHPNGPIAEDPADPRTQRAQHSAVREPATIPAVEVITRASVMLMSAAAEKLGLAEDGERYLDLTTPGPGAWRKVRLLGIRPGLQQ